MANYFRITAYHPTENFSVIMDSNGMFEKLWQFSADIVQKGFKIIEVGDSNKFLEGEIPLDKLELNKYILRANAKNTPQYTTVNVNGINYKAIRVKNKTYIPDKNIIESDY